MIRRFLSRSSLRSFLAAKCELSINAAGAGGPTLARSRLAGVWNPKVFVGRFLGKSIAASLVRPHVAKGFVDHRSRPAHRWLPHPQLRWFATEGSTPNWAQSLATSKARRLAPRRPFTDSEGLCALHSRAETARTPVGSSAHWANRNKATGSEQMRRSYRSQLQVFPDAARFVRTYLAIAAPTTLASWIVSDPTCPVALSRTTMCSSVASRANGSSSANVAPPWSNVARFSLVT